jgi:hypothetical protein
MPKAVCTVAGVPFGLGRSFYPFPCSCTQSPKSLILARAISAARAGFGRGPY